MNKLLPMHTFTKYFKNVFYLSLFLMTGIGARAQNIFTEGFEGSSFPPTSWVMTASDGSSYWSRGGSGSGYAGYGTTVSPHGGTKMAYYDNWNIYYQQSNLITKAVPLQNYSGGHGQVSFWFYRMSDYGSDNVQVYANTTQDMNGSPTLLGTIYVNMGTAPSVSVKGWYPYSFAIPASYNNANVYIIFKANSQWEYDSYMDDVSLDYIPPCASPTTSPLGVALTATPGTISGVISPAPGSDGTLVVRTVGTTPVAAIPLDGVTYTVGQSFGNGVVVSVGSATSFTDNGIPSSTLYSYTSYAMNSICSGGPKYYTVGTTNTITSAYTGYVSVPVTGYNVDAICNGNAPPASTTDFSALAIPGFDNANDVWAAFDYSFNGNTASCGQFPNGGIIPSSQTTGLSWQLASYTGLNTLMLTTASPSTAGEIPTTTGTLTLTTPISTPTLYLLMSAANAGTVPTFTATVNFTDGSNQAFTGLTCADWTQGTPTFNTAGRVVTTSGSCIGSARLFQQGLSISAANYSKRISSITFHVTAPSSGNQDLGIFAISAVGACNSTPSSAVSITTSPITVPICSGTNVTLTTSSPNISSASGLLPVWQQAASASGPWTTVSLSSTASANSYTFTSPNLVDSTFYRVYDSCTATHQVGPVSAVFAVPVAKQTFPYLETFNSTPNDVTPSCYVVNDNNGTNWAVRNDIHAADGTPLTAIRANDPVANAMYGKNDFFTLPSFKLTGSQVYQIRFKYARGKSDPVGNTGTAYPEHLQVYVNSNAPGYVVNNVTSGSLIFDKTINFDNIADTTIYFSVPTSAGYYLSWYSNTAHPGGITSSVDGGIVIVDSIYINTASCVAPAIVSMPATASACVGTPVTLGVVASGTANKYQWQKSGVNITGATNPTYTIASPALTDAGNYDVVITNPCGTVTTGNITALTVHSLPTAGVTPNTTATACAGAGYRLTAITNAADPVYQWINSGANISGALANSYVPASTGLYSVRVTDNSDGCIATSGSDSVIILPSPPASILAGGPTTFCTGSNVSLYANIGSGYTYKWLNGSNVISGQTASSLTGINTAGQYKVVVTAGGCPDTSAATVVTITPPPTAAITAMGPTTFCSGGNVVLNATAGSGYTYQGRLNGSLINWTNASYTASATGSYDVIVSAAGGCSDTSAPVMVSVSAAPQAMVTPVGTVGICTGDSAMLTANAGAGYTYQWFMNGSPLSMTDTGMTYTALQAGDYQVAVKNATGCSDTSSATVVTVTPLPMATIVSVPASGNVCQGSTFTLTANTGIGLTYQWQLNGSDISGATGASYTDSVAGDYTVVVGNANGCRNVSVAKTITLNAVPSVTINPSGATTFCQGGTVTFVATPSTGLMYQWQKNSVNVATGGTGASYAVTASGNYDVVVTDPASGCRTTSSAQTVTVNAAPVAALAANGPTTLCPNMTVTLTAQPTGGAYTHEWYKNGAVYNVNTSTETFGSTDAGNYTIKVTSLVTGCSDSLSAPTVISAGAGVTAVIAPTGPTTFCSGNSVVLTTNESLGVTYQWMLNASPITNATSSSYTASTAGNYTVKISNTGCSDTSSPVSVVVNPNPTAVVTENGPTTFCSNANVILSANTGTGYTYQWKRNGASVTGNGATTANYTADTTGVYTVVVTNASGCTATSAPPVSVTVNAAPSAAITSTGSTTICAGDTDRLYVNEQPGTYTYQWIVFTNNIAGATAGYYNATTSGSYSVMVTATNGCTANSEPVTVIVNPVPTPVITLSGSTLSVTAAYTTYQWYYNGQAIDGATSATYDATQSGAYSVFVTDGNCGGMSALYQLPNTAVNGVSLKDAVKIYPNPANSVIHIDAPVRVKVSISGLDGRIVIMKQNVKDIDISQLANGTYMVTVADESDHVIKVDKLVKTN